MSNRMLNQNSTLEGSVSPDDNYNLEDAKRALNKQSAEQLYEMPTNIKYQPQKLINAQITNVDTEIEDQDKNSSLGRKKVELDTAKDFNKAFSKLSQKRDVADTVKNILSQSNHVHTRMKREIKKVIKPRVLDDRRHSY